MHGGVGATSSPTLSQGSAAWVGASLSSTSTTARRSMWAAGELVCREAAMEEEGAPRKLEGARKPAMEAAPRKLAMEGIRVKRGSLHICCPQNNLYDKHMKNKL